MGALFPGTARNGRKKALPVEEELAAVSPGRDTLVTIGVFDGVHLGHRHLIAELIRQARERDLQAAAVTFRQHPEDYMLSKSKLPFLTDIETRVNLLHAAGIDIVVPLSFTQSLANLSPRDFVRLLQRYLRMKGLVIGSDFALGHDRAGDIPTLRKLGAELGFGVTVVPPLVINGETVSSTTIRKAMADGDMAKVRALAGRYFQLHGKVVTGAGRGDDLGFPTANLAVGDGHALPPDGVYAGIARVNGSVYPAMTNIGKNPTFGKDNARTIEAFLLDYRGDLYGHEIAVDFVARLRDEKKFRNAAELQRQMTEDVARGKQALNAAGLYPAGKN
jgi:riboflavin kinase/FMN adenylyltransferase